MSFAMEITKYLSAINILLVISLMVIYWKNFQKIKSGFTFGLLLFSVIFLLQNAICLYFTITMMPYYVEGVQGYVLALTAMQTFAFSTMNYITWK